MNPIFHAAVLEDERKAVGQLRPERLFLVAGLGFLGLAVALAYSYDMALLRAIHPGLDAATVLFWRVMSFLGSGYFLALIVALISLVLVGKRQGATALWLVLGWATCGLTVEWLKWLIGRNRPPVPLLGYAAGASFPSGHAAQSLYLCGYLFWVVLASSYLGGNPNPSWTKHSRAVILLALLVLPMIVGVSRVYLGAHWPSDVLAGWGIGLVFSGIALLSRP